jgi:hypothetical protein
MDAAAAGGPPATLGAVGRSAGCAMSYGTHVYDIVRYDGLDWARDEDRYRILSVT